MLIAPTGRNPSTDAPSFFEEISSVGRTPFQMNAIEQISKQPDFMHFVGNPGCDEPYEGPCSVLYYTTDQKLNLVRLHQRRIARHIVAK